MKELHLKFCLLWHYPTFPLLRLLRLITKLHVSILCFNTVSCLGQMIYYSFRKIQCPFSQGLCSQYTYYYYIKNLTKEQGSLEVTKQEGITGGKPKISIAISLTLRQFTCRDLLQPTLHNYVQHILYDPSNDNQLFTILTYTVQLDSGPTMLSRHSYQLYLVTK